MMSDIKNIFDVSGYAMASQMTRLNTIASNLANAGAISSTPEDAYRALRPVFSTQYADKVKENGISTVQSEEIVALNRKPVEIYQPGHPKADENGYIYRAAVNTDEEMVEMLEASRQYQNNLEVVSTLRNLMLRTVNMGR